ncbi:MAG: hypothetical protein C0404_09030 [Verrucomicrobia bacterium]|nr:hypothetical protein [Verrucomicrobiota bacterium]
MPGRKQIITAILVCASISVIGAEPAQETLLPLHDGRDAYTPRAAFGKDVFLVTWQSGRTGPGDIRKGLHFIGDIVACRVDKSGKALDAAPTVVCGAADLQEKPQVAFGGNTFLAVWQDARNGKDWDLYAARILPDGKVLDKEGFLVSGGPHNQAKPRVAWDGKSFAVVWQDFRDGKYYSIYTARISTDGKVLDAEGVKVASGGFYHCFEPALAAVGGGRSFVLNLAVGLPVDTYRCPMAQGWFIADGKPDSAPAYALDKKKDSKHGPEDRAQPIALAFGGGAFLSAWKNDASLGRGFGPDGNAALFDDKGARKESLNFSGGQGKTDSKRILDPDIVWDGSAFLLAWYEFVRGKKDDCPMDATFVARVGPDGKTIGAVQKIAGTSANPASAPGVASDGSGLSLIAYERHPETADVPIKVGLRILSTGGK